MDAVIDDVVNDLPPLVPFADAAKRLGVDRATLRRWANAGRVVVVKTSPGRCGRALVPRVEIGRQIRRLAS